MRGRWPSKSETPSIQIGLVFQVLVKRSIWWRLLRAIFIGVDFMASDTRMLHHLEKSHPCLAVDGYGNLGRGNLLFILPAHLLS
jgi:hypothetical protein